MVAISDLKSTERLVQTNPDKKTARAEKRKAESDFAPKGIYLNTDNAGSKKVFTYIKKLKRAACNTIVFDVKDVDGTVRYATSSELAKSTDAAKNTIPLSRLIFLLKMKEIHAAARIAVFRDDHLSAKRKDLKLKYTCSKVSPEAANWVDPSSEEVINYNLEIAVELARAGADEINFDYVRYPGIRDIDTGNRERSEVITSFLKKAKERLKPYGARISVDVFASTVWPENGETTRIIGQDPIEMAKYVDALYIMAYPSHFYGLPNMKNPTDHPYEIVLKTCKYAKTLLKDTDVRLTLFLQAFSYKNKEFPYGARYVAEQLKAAHDGGMDGFLFWNVDNSYDYFFEGLNDLQNRSNH